MPRKTKKKQKLQANQKALGVAKPQKTKNKGKILWANSFCLMDTSSGASISIRQMLNQLILAEFEVDIVGATIFDAPIGKERISKIWKQITDAKASLVNIEDGRLLHRLVKTECTERSKMSLEEANKVFYTFVTRLDEFEPDVFFYYGGSPLEFLMAAEARVRGIPTMAYLVNANYQGVRWCRDVDQIITDTHATSSMYSERQGFIPLPIGKFIDPANIIAKKHERKHLTFINPSYTKGAGIVAQVAYILEKKRPDIKIEIVQSRGNWTEVLKAVTKEFFGDERSELKNTILTPNTPNMNEVYERSRVVFAPSLWWESGSRVLAEAMLNGIPAIVSNRGGNAEMIGEGGLVVDLPQELYEAPYAKLPGRPIVEKIIQVIETFWDDEDQYIYFVKKAMLKGYTDHSLENSTSKLIQIINKLKEGKGRINRDETLKNIHKHSLVDERYNYGQEKSKIEKKIDNDHSCNIKKIAMVTPFFWPHQNGMEMAFHKLATEFVNQQYSIDMYAPVHKEKFEELDANYPIIRIKDEDHFLQIMKQRHKQKSYDYILCQSAYVGAALGLKAQKEIQVPVILRTHGVDIQKDRENQYGWRLDSSREKIILDNINRVNACVISAQLQEEFQIIAPNTPSRVIQSGIDQKVFYPDRNHFLHEHIGLDRKTKIILMVGRNVKKKNFHLGIKAFQEANLNKNEAILVHVGHDGDGQNLHEHANKLGVQNRFFSFGQILHRDIPKIYNSADILLFPSKTEMFGNVTLEAMACGLAPVEFDYGANKDKIENGTNGFIVPFGDTIRMGEIINLLIKNPDQLRSIQNEALRYAKQNFTILETVKNYEKLFSLANENFVRN